jgi:hypothetical protein
MNDVVLLGQRLVRESGTHVRLTHVGDAATDRAAADGPVAVDDRRSPIEVHIERLVLHDFAPGDRRRIGAAVVRELERLLAEGGAPAGLGRSGALARLDRQSFLVAPGADAAAVGAQVAQAIYRGLAR